MDSQGLNLLKLVYEDITVACECMKRGGLGYNTAAFHIQQAFEKLLKVILYSHGYSDTQLKTHNISRLVMWVQKLGS